MSEIIDKALHVTNETADIEFKRAFDTTSKPKFRTLKTE